MVGGRIEIRYDRDGAFVTAVNDGDYIYPSDVPCVSMTVSIASM